ncbi:hypothetical protein HRI_001865900 [Hibiscus trionum]|uniref:Retroviral polymerase SH3-like domain-containing protein n=1 Tax=Hibiscus trionum TaxID=183268 RepID=A0A9W7LZF4_HIBTR|nr:hypothetical protein HRI_001865900 [Hibiscus trionum]
MGYSLHQKGYVLFNITSKTFFISRDVVFHEYIFPFQTCDSSSPLFPLTSLQTVDHEFLYIPVTEQPLPPFTPSSPVPTEHSPLPTEHSPVPPEHSPIPTEHSPVPPAPLSMPTEASVSPPISHVVSSISLRKSTRVSKPPTWLSDFVCPANSSPSTSLLTGSYPISSCIGYNHLPPTTRHFAISLSSIVEPHSYQMTITDPRWVEAMQLEIQALEANGTWAVVNLPPGKKVIGCKWTSSTLSCRVIYMRRFI